MSKVSNLFLVTEKKKRENTILYLLDRGKYYFDK